MHKRTHWLLTIKGLTMTHLPPRSFRTFNYIGLYTLYIKEIKRFLNIFTQTIVAPVITSVMFLSVFTLSIGRIQPTVNGLSFTQFLIPGLICMTMIQNSFANTSSAIVSGKMMGSITDLLMPPLSSLEIVIAHGLASITRGLLLTIVNLIGMSLFADISFASISFIELFVFSVLTCWFMSMIGFISGVWAHTWDNLSSITTYIITPLSFLSGTFYSLDKLPAFFQKMALFNPLFYMIDGVRHSMTGYSNMAEYKSYSYMFELLVLFGLCLILSYIAWRILEKGWKLKS